MGTKKQKKNNQKAKQKLMEWIRWFFFAICCHNSFLERWEVKSTWIIPSAKIKCAYVIELRKKWCWFHWWSARKLIKEKHKCGSLGLFRGRYYRKYELSSLLFSSLFSPLLSRCFFCFIYPAQMHLDSTFGGLGLDT